MAELYMLVGLPGSGKTSWANQMGSEDCVVCSSDALRKELFGSENVQDKNSKLFAELHRRIRQHLTEGRSVVYDATNINAKRRQAFLREIEKIYCKKIAVVFAVPFEKCLRNNWMRERKVPYEAMERMYKGWQMPYYFEGWDEILVVDDQADIREYPIELNSYNQNNPWHEETLGYHMLHTYYYVAHRTVNGPLWQAAFYHDIRKPFCRFEDDDSVSRYFGHENVGAYDALSIYGLSLDAAALINYHMRPMQWDQTDYPETTAEKYRKKWGKEFVDNLLLLHEADINSKEESINGQISRES